MKVDNLIVGCGISGAVLARKLADAGQEVLIIDEREHIGGNIFDYKDENGITVHKYGPHVFHTSNEKVWDFLSDFTSWRPLSYHVRTVVNGKEISLPFNLNSLEQVFEQKKAVRLSKKLMETYGQGARISILALIKSEDDDLANLGEQIFEKIYAGYTMKQWGVGCKSLDTSVITRVPVKVSHDNDYFYDRYEAIPAGGYTMLIQNLLDHPSIATKTSVPFKEIRDSVTYDNLFFSGSIDSFFYFKFGKLPYRSVVYKLKIFNREYYQSGPQINYPNDHAYTRSIEHKYFLGERSPKTTVTFEYPQPFRDGVNHRCYPILCPENRQLHQKYLDKSSRLANIVFFGRLGDYRYYNMDVAVARALELGERYT